MKRRWLPHPILSVMLLIIWLLLNNTLAPGHIVLGAIIGVAIPWFSARFWTDDARFLRPAVLVRFVPLVLWDIVVANVVVAKLIVGPSARLRPAFVQIPLDITNPHAITALASVITLTPGTVSADLSADRKTLLVHALDVPDEAELIASIKQRYERPLKELFE